MTCGHLRPMLNIKLAVRSEAWYLTAILNSDVLPRHAGAVRRSNSRRSWPEDLGVGLAAGRAEGDGQSRTPRASRRLVPASARPAASAPQVAAPPSAGRCPLERRRRQAMTSAATSSPEGALSQVPSLSARSPASARDRVRDLPGTVDAGHGLPQKSPRRARTEGDLPNSSQYGNSSHPERRMRAVQ